MIYGNDKKKIIKKVLIKKKINIKKKLMINMQHLVIVLHTYKTKNIKEVNIRNVRNKKKIIDKMYDHSQQINIYINTIK